MKQIRVLKGYDLIAVVNDTAAAYAVVRLHAGDGDRSEYWFREQINGV